MADTKGFTITQGDDSNALGNTMGFELETDLDLTGYRAIFQIAKLQWKFNDITSKELSFIITKEQTYELSEGVEYGALKIFDADNRPITIIRDIPVYVKTQVVDND